MHHNHYIKLAAMAVLSFIAMYVLMYAMVDRFGNVFSNVNQFYMAGLMTAPMVAIEILLMGEMYKNRTANAAILVLSLIALGGFWFAIRSQAAVNDTQFLRSMIPHHAGAVLMCEQAPLRDPQVKWLCGQIVKSQNEEIALMKAWLENARN
jgi:uncharacterized protein (DUF305 family)